VIAIVVVMFSMGFFSGEPAPNITAPPPTTNARPANGQPSRGPGAGAGLPVPGNPGQDASGLPPGRL
jgi:hypothetical protein